jgi:hypothetical protein
MNCPQLPSSGRRAIEEKTRKLKLAAVGRGRLDASCRVRSIRGGETVSETASYLGVDLMRARLGAFGTTLPASCGPALAIGAEPQDPGGAPTYETVSSVNLGTALVVTPEVVRR